MSVDLGRGTRRFQRFVTLGGAKPAGGEPPKPRGVLDPDLLRSAIPHAFRKLDPRLLIKNPVMFVVEITAVLVTADRHRRRRRRRSAAGAGGLGFAVQIAIWLWFTVLFATYAEAVAEARGRAQAATLRKTRSETTAHRRKADGTLEDVGSSELRKGDIIVVEEGETIAGDGDVIEGIGFVNEAAITGESAPVLKEPGTDIRSSVTGGTTLVSDRIVVRGHDRPRRDVPRPDDRARRGRQAPAHAQRDRARDPAGRADDRLPDGDRHPAAVRRSTPARPSIRSRSWRCSCASSRPRSAACCRRSGSPGMDRVARFNVLAMSGRAVEASGDVDVILLDKTGTITYGNRLAASITPAAGRDRGGGRRGGPGVVDPGRDARGPLDRRARPQAAGRARPPGRRRRRRGLRDAAARPSSRRSPSAPRPARAGSRRPAGTTILKGAVDAIEKKVGDAARRSVAADADRIADLGATPLVLESEGRVLGVIELKDTVKEGLVERFAEFRRMGIRTVMITGDNPRTAATIAREAGVDDFIAQATPEEKIAFIRTQQAEGHLVAMTGDGTNDAPALAQSDVGLAMNSGTSAAKDAANMVDLDSDPTKLLEVIAIGKQLLITRGSITTFSIANDVAKYFAIVPAMFVAVFPELNALNVMGLATPQSAILSAVIFNALIIVALIPLALRGVAFKPAPASELLQRNLLIYGLGGIIAPFIGIKAIDLIVSGPQPRIGQIDDHLPSTPAVAGHRPPRSR